jgi:hypothetical protein
VFLHNLGRIATLALWFRKPSPAAAKAPLQRGANDLNPALIESPAQTIRERLNVVVRDGRVDLWCSLFEERERQALRVVAENVPGVREVHHHMVWIEPIMGAVVLAPEEA